LRIHAATLRLTSNELPRCRAVVSQRLVTDMVNPPFRFQLQQTRHPHRLAPPSRPVHPKPQDLTPSWPGAPGAPAVGVTMVGIGSVVWVGRILHSILRLRFWCMLWLFFECATGASAAGDGQGRWVQRLCIGDYSASVPPSN
jgi:hypothetical protein